MMEQLSALPVGSLLRILQTIPVAVLEVAVNGACRSPCPDGSGWRDRAPPPGSR
jgi:hypothetical protein